MKPRRTWRGAAATETRISCQADAGKVTLSYSVVSLTRFPVIVAVEKAFFRGEESVIQQQSKKTNVPVNIAHTMTLLQEVQREMGL